MPKRSLNQVVEDWLLNSECHYHLDWALDASPETWDKSLYDFVSDEPETAWSLILKILEHPLTDEQIASLAAGPVEDLLAQHGPQFIERVEREAKQSACFNHLLGGVWQNTMSEEIWERVQRVRREIW